MPVITLLSKVLFIKGSDSYSVRPAVYVSIYYILNAAARLVFGLRRHVHVPDALSVLHWLRIGLPDRIDFKLAVTTLRVLQGLAPSNLDHLARVADVP
jgi:hypothetical protein